MRNKFLLTGLVMLVGVLSTALSAQVAPVLGAPNGGYSGSPILITEIDAGSPDAIEVANVTSAAFDATGWQLIVSNSYAVINTANTTTQTLGNFAAVQHEYWTDAATNPWGSNLFWNPNSQSWAMLIDNTGTVRDFVAWHWPAAAIAAMSVNAGGYTGLNPSAVWSGDGLTSSASSILRTGNSVNGDATDWTNGAGSFGTANAGLSVPLSSSGVMLGGTDPAFTGLAYVGEDISTSFVATDADVADVLSFTVTVTGGTLTAAVAGYNETFPFAPTGGVSPQSAPLTGTAAAAGTIELTVQVSDTTNTDSYTFTLTILAAANEMDLTRGANAIADAGTDAITTANYETVPLAALTYTIDNTGVLDLNLTGGGTLVAQSNATNCAAVIVDPTTNPISANGLDTFTVTVTPAAAGAWSIDISIDNDDANENPYNFTISGTALVAASEMDVSRGAAAIADGGSDAYAVANFALSPIGLTYTIDNTGVLGLNLTGGGTLVAQSNATNCAAVIVDPTTNPIAAAASDTFTVTVTPATPGAWSIDISIDNDDPNENPYNFTISGTATLANPEMDISRGATAIADGGTDTYAAAIFALMPTGLTYTIDNTGADPLGLTGTSGLVVQSNAVNCAAVIIDPTTNPIAAAASDTFTVMVTPATPGAWSIDISIDNNDQNENPYNFTISGTAVAGLSIPFSENFDAWTVQNGNPNPLTGGWENDAADAGPVDWWTHIGGTTSTGTGPTVDQSTGTATGVYMYVEDSNAIQTGSPPDVNLLTPPVDLAGTTNPVLRFWVHANDNNGIGGTTNNMLHIDIIDLTAATTTADVITAITHVSDATLQVWTEYVVDLTAFVGNTIRVRFRLHQTGTSFTHDVCIDSVSIGEPPEMAVTRSGPIADGSTDNVDIITSGSQLTYTIDNLGVSDLNLTGSPLVVVTAGTNVATVTVSTTPSTPVASAGSTTFVIAVTATAAGAYDFTVSIDNNDPDENPYDFTVSGTSVSNVPPAVAVIGSNWVNAGGGVFTLALNPGDTINDALTVTDATPNDMTVTVTNPATAMTTLTAQPVTNATAVTGPISLLWTGTADAGSVPGNFDWTIDINDGFSSTVITARIIIIDVPPTHVIANAVAGDGSTGAPYTASFVQGDDGTVSVNLATVTDANTGQNPALGTVTNTVIPGAATGAFNFTLVSGTTLRIAPAAALLVVDGGAWSYTVDVTDGTNTVTINVDLTVSTVSGNITFTNTNPLAIGTVNAAYATVTLAATGGTPAYTFALVNSTSLPAGLTLSASGDITGTPTAVGTTTFDIRVTDSTNDTATTSFDITINTAAIGGGGGGGCAASASGSSLWLALLGLLGLVAVTRLRSVRN